MYQPDKHHHRSIRLRHYDYWSAGACFITICTCQQEHLFGYMVNGQMVLNDIGIIVRDEWFNTSNLRPNVEKL